MGLHPTPLPTSNPLDRLLMKRKLISMTTTTDQGDQGEMVIPNKKICFESRKDEEDTNCKEGKHF